MVNTELVLRRKDRVPDCRKNMRLPEGKKFMFVFGSNCGRQCHYEFNTVF